MIQTYASLKAPSSRNVTSFLTWLKNQKLLVPSESDFMKHQDDFVALSGERESGWLDGIVEDSLAGVFPRRIMRVCVNDDYHCTGNHSKKIPFVAQLVA